MREKRTRIRVYYNRNKQIIKKKKVYFFKFAKNKNNCANFLKINIT